MGLSQYHSKRNFKATPEPRGKKAHRKKSSRKKSRQKNSLSYVIQKHHARRLHYDFRLEYDGVLKSWAVPKGPSLDPHDRRLAVEVEDHPLDYGGFEGEIPKGHYGAGHVIVWDRGEWEPIGSVPAGLKKGHLQFKLVGEKLGGEWSLVRLKSKDRGKNNWLLIKKQDEAARTDYEIVEEQPESVVKSKAPAKRKKSRASAPPEFVKPQLALLVDELPEDKEWIHEIKFDGYRTQARIYNDDIRLLTRSGLDWTKRYGSLVDELKKLPTANALVDGEIVWANEKGQADFQKLQNALSEGKSQRLVYYLFDLLCLDGKDLREWPLKKRKALLQELLSQSSSRRLIYSEHWREEGPELLKQSCRLGLEGIVSKDENQPYVSGRSGIWKKTKCSLRQEFVIGGYTVSPKDRALGALLLGVFEKDQSLRYVGRVGTGFTAATLEELKEKFEDLETDQSPFDISSPGGRSLRWLKPKLAAEVEFKAWTGDRILRHASFQGLRSDKPAKIIHQEKAVPKTKLALTHPDRVLYPKTKTVKAEVFAYYQAVASLMAPFVKDRPLSILRCQESVGDSCFFQKHGLAGFEDHEVHYKNKSGEAIGLRTQADILRLVQSGGVEIHAWGAQFSHITTPDLIVFDLDPETIKLWPRVVETAHSIREKLEQLGLKSFVKVTGGKGLHVHVPISPRYPWDDIKAFSKSLMKVLEDEAPKNFTTNMIKSKRKGRIFLDYLRNGYGATAVVPYSLRAREKPTVALPISWKDVKASLAPDEFTIDEVVKKIKRRKDPWSGYWSLKQKIKVLENSSQRKRLVHDGEVGIHA